MPKFSLTKKAVEDLRQIWNYTYDNWSENQADKYVNQLLAHCSEISNKPIQGKAYATVLPNLRGSRINRHIIFYRILKKKNIEVVRV